MASAPVFSFAEPVSPPKVIQCIPCPLSSKDNYELQDRIRIATHMFNCSCPPTAKVAYVAPIRYRGQYKCAWRVQYSREMSYSFRISRHRLFEDISRNQPQNTRIVKRLPIGVPPQQELHYALINCNCVPNESLNIIDIEFNPNEVLADGFGNINLRDE